MRLEEQEFSKRSKLKIWVFIKLGCVFQENSSIFEKSLKVPKFARDCDWIGKILKKFKVKNLGL